MTMRWELNDLVGASDIADRYGVGRAAVSNWIKRFEDFPTALTTVGGNRIYSRKQVHTWYEKQFGGRTDRLLERANELETAARKLREAAARADAQCKGPASDRDDLT